jgi:hypothetical protein
MAAFAIKNMLSGRISLISPDGAFTRTKDKWRSGSRLGYVGDLLFHKWSGNWKIANRSKGKLKKSEEGIMPYMITTYIGGKIHEVIAIDENSIPLRARMVYDTEEQCLQSVEAATKFVIAEIGEVTKEEANVNYDFKIIEQKWFF